MIIITGICLGFLFGHRSRSLHTKPLVLKTCSGHFTGSPGFEQAALIEPVKGVLDSNYIILYHQQGTDQAQIWKSPPAPIWDIHFADLDGDSLDELALCLYKEEPHDPNMDNRLHIYGWRSESVHALWRGTFLSKPFEHVMFGDIDGDSAQELIALERSRRTPLRKFLTVYRWNGFGFDFISDIGVDASTDSLNMPTDSREILVSGINDQTIYHIVGDTIVRGEQ
jgi:hypothetical protein